MLDINARLHLLCLKNLELLEVSDQGWILIHRHFGKDLKEKIIKYFKYNASDEDKDNTLPLTRSYTIKKMGEEVLIGLLEHKEDYLHKCKYLRGEINPEEETSCLPLPNPKSDKAIKLSKEYDELCDQIASYIQLFFGAVMRETDVILSFEKLLTENKHLKVEIKQEDYEDHIDLLKNSRRELIALQKRDAEIIKKLELNAPELPQYSFRLKHDKWEVIYEGCEAFYIKESLGAKYIDYMLHRPGKLIDRIELYVESNKFISDEFCKLIRGVNANANENIYSKYASMFGFRSRNAVKDYAYIYEIYSSLKEVDAKIKKIESDKIEGVDSGTSQLEYFRHEERELKKCLKTQNEQTRNQKPAEIVRNSVRKAITPLIKKLIKASSPVERKFGEHLKSELHYTVDPCRYENNQDFDWQ